MSPTKEEKEQQTKMTELAKLGEGAIDHYFEELVELGISAAAAEKQSSLIKHLMKSVATTHPDRRKETLIVRHGAVKEILCDISSLINIGDYLVIDRSDKFGVRVGEVKLVDMGRGYVGYRDLSNGMEDFLYITAPDIIIHEHYRADERSPLSQLLARTDALNLAKEKNNVPSESVKL